MFAAPTILAAIGPKVTEMGAEVADGMFVPAFTTPRYLTEVTLPAIERGLAASVRSRADFQVAYPAFVLTGIVTGKNERASEEVARVRRELACVLWLNSVVSAGPHQRD